MRGSGISNFRPIDARAPHTVKGTNNLLTPCNTSHIHQIVMTPTATRSNDVILTKGSLNFVAKKKEA